MIEIIINKYDAKYGSKLLFIFLFSMEQRLCNGLPRDGQGFNSRWERCKNQASRLSQGTVNGGAISKSLTVDGMLNTTKQTKPTIFSYFCKLKKEQNMNLPCHHALCYVRDLVIKCSPFCKVLYVFIQYEEKCFLYWNSHTLFDNEGIQSPFCL